jgi:hypothetical protein
MNEWENIGTSRNLELSFKSGSTNQAEKDIKILV